MGYAGESGHTKDYDEAERLYRKALELDPSGAEITRIAEDLATVRGESDQADRFYRKALELDPTNESLSEKYDAFRNAHRS